MTETTRVFISYSHDSPAHKAEVLSLANRLRNDGVDCHLDQYGPFPSEGWPHWTSDQIADADFVLVVCTEIYARRAEGREAPSRGLGASWEGQLITQEGYDSGGRNCKFIPVILRGGDFAHIPAFLAPATRFNLGGDADYESLLRLLTRQPAVLMPAVGPVRSLPPLGGPSGSVSSPALQSTERVNKNETPSVKV